MNCETCIHWIEDENWVPYGSTFVLESRIAECELGYEADCPEGTYRYRPTREEAWIERGDWMYHMKKDDGLI